MKSSIVIFLTVLTVFLQGMEVPKTQDFLIGKTNVRLTKGCIYDVDGPENLMIIGFHEQRRFKSILYGKNDYAQGGCTYGLVNRLAYIKNKDDASLSEDDDYKVYDNKEFWKNADTKKLSSQVLQVYEPQISLQKDSTGKEDHLYIVEKSDRFSCTGRRIWIGPEALQEAKKDLTVCYERILGIGLHCKTIAIPALSVDVGFPRQEAAYVALETIIKSLHGYKNKLIKSYDLIYLYVKKRSEFEFYKKLLEEPCLLRFRYKIFLLSYINKYSEQFLLQLPQEIIQYILFLWYHCLIENHKA